MKSFKYLIGPFFGGIVFAIGLGMGGMTEPTKIVAFLDVFGNWEPDLLFVMGGAVSTYAIFYRWVLKRKQPLFESSFSIPTSKAIDKRLILGSALFGIGWGMTGLCPAPGLVGLTSGATYALVFVGTMILGMLLGRSQFGQKLFTKV